MAAAPKSLDHLLPDTARKLIVQYVLDETPFTLPSYLGAREGLLTKEEAYGSTEVAVRKMQMNSHLRKINTSILGAAICRYNQTAKQERRQKRREELRSCYLKEPSQRYQTEYQRAFQDQTNIEQDKKDDPAVSTLIKNRRNKSCECSDYSQ